MDMLLTDPPYNVALGMHDDPESAQQRHRRTDGLVVENDEWENDEDFIQFLRSAFFSALSVMKPGAVFYIWYAYGQAQNFLSACKAAEIQIRQTLIWNKNSFALGRQDYQWKHEPCLYGWKGGAAHTWRGDRTQSTVLDFPRPVRSAEHPTMKPIELFDYLMQNSTAPGDIVLDIFAGSGTTMIAAEQNGRTAYCMEIDPKCCDVIVDRWEKLTGKKAVKL